MDAQARYASILEEGLGKPAYEHWIEDRFFKPREKDYTFPMPHGKFGSVEWFFHGLEVDLVDRATDFRIRIDLGPAGRLDCFTESGIQEMLSNEWIARRFPNVQEYIQRNDTKGTFWVIRDLLEELRLEGSIDYAEPELVELMRKYSYEDENGDTHVNIPEGLGPTDKSRMLFSDRYVLVPGARAAVCGTD